MLSAHPWPKAVSVWLALGLSTLVPCVSAAKDAEVVKLVGTLHGIGGKFAYFSPDGAKLLTVGKDAARVWDLRTMKPVADAAIKHEGDIEDAGWLADGERVFTAGGKEVRVWDPLTPKVVASVRQDVPVKTGCVSPDGKLIVAGNRPGAGKVWDAASAKPLYSLEGPGQLVAAQFSRDGRKLLTVTLEEKNYFGGSAVVRILDPNTGKALSPPKMFGNLSKDAPPAKFSPDGSKFVVPEEKDFIVFDASSGERICEGGADGGLDAGLTVVVHFTKDGKVLASQDVETGIYDPGTGKAIWKSVHHSAWPGYRQYVANNGDGSLVFFANRMDEASVWDMRTGQELQEFGQPGTEAVAVSPSGRFVALVYSREPTEIWEVNRK